MEQSNFDFQNLVLIICPLSKNMSQFHLKRWIIFVLVDTGPLNSTPKNWSYCNVNFWKCTSLSASFSDKETRWTEPEAEVWIPCWNSSRAVSDIDVLGPSDEGAFLRWLPVQSEFSWGVPSDSCGLSHESDWRNDCEYGLWYRFLQKNKY